jgi:cytochrome c-type biogenesis protein CcmE
MNRYFKFGIPIAAILGTLAWLAVSTPKEAVGYFKTIPEVKQMGDQAHVKHLRVNGYVKEGSIAHEGSKTVFLLVENPGDGNVGDNLKVVYSGDDPLPDTFKDRAQALADGKLGSDGVFHATQIQAKCASKYEAAPPPSSASKPSTI